MREKLRDRGAIPRDAVDTPVGKPGVGQAHPESFNGAGLHARAEPPEWFEVHLGQNSG